MKQREYILTGPTTLNTFSFLSYYFVLLYTFFLISVFISYIYIYVYVYNLKGRRELYVLQIHFFRDALKRNKVSIYWDGGSRQLVQVWARAFTNNEFACLINQQSILHQHGSIFNFVEVIDSLLKTIRLFKFLAPSLINYICKLIQNSDIYINLSYE